MLPALLTRQETHSSARRLTAIIGLLWLAALVCLPWADLDIRATEPLDELARIGWGLITPGWDDPASLVQALGQTVAFALLAVAISAPLGLLAALMFHWWPVRLLAAALRSVHEIFWALIFMQIWGLSATTGLLAILVPYTGVFTKVFAETLALQNRTPEQSLPPAWRLIRWLYTRIPQALPPLLQYTRYRFECALRSSAILGFIGLPTLGFHLETAFKQGQYSEAAMLLWAFVALIASIRYWLRPKLIPVYLLIAIWLLPETIGFSNPGYLWQFISQDIWPAPLLAGDLSGTFDWYWKLLSGQAWQGLLQTLLLSQLALLLTLLIVLLVYPLATRRLVGPKIWWPGRLLLLLMRSTPEMVMAYVFLLLLGPSGLPAVLALAIHNGGLIGFLVAGKSEMEYQRQQQQPLQEPSGLLLYSYVETPRQLPALLAWLFYRWEVILRESAILGILGITTLGFYIDSAFEEIRYDRAFMLILVTALLNMLVDGVSRWLRRLAEPQAVSAGRG
ncbi:PhnE/PtxC family ABC transporter permease [Oceanobacter mangrovi]|uniref:PhnE/PtxC family ABC transporter permease n=1 Tax=Oceanobacter mangrovi TaxID=2862510 RepID=UPI001FE27EC5|nr:hypothetical protein [Oceanobacter mangrovi]